MPRIGEYFGKLFSIEPSRGAEPVPVLAFGHLLGGVREPQSVAYWFYRINVYLVLLWQTIQMAVVATVMGFTLAFALSFPATVQFYAQFSLLDAGAMIWQLQNALPVQGTLSGNQFTETTDTVALVSGCNCAADLNETVTLQADGGFVLGAPLLFGLVDDRLDPAAELDAGPVCGSPDAGVPVDAGCGLACDLIYEVSGVPSEPYGGY